MATLAKRKIKGGVSYAVQFIVNGQRKTRHRRIRRRTGTPLERAAFGGTESWGEKWRLSLENTVQESKNAVDF